MNRDADKKAAALAAADEVEGGMLVGLGTGSTAAFLIAELGGRCRDGLAIEVVATSHASQALARAAGMKLRAMAEVATLDLAIDGADEIDPALRAIKGAGGAMLREKIVAAAARRMVVIADAAKRVARLGAAPLPIELVPFAHASVAAAIARLGGVPVLRQTGDVAARTDQDNLILDCRFGLLANPAALAAALSAIPGLVGHGLFLDEIDAAYIAEGGQVARIERPGAG